MMIKGIIAAAAMVGSMATVAHADIYNNSFGMSVIETTTGGGFNAQNLPGFCSGSTPLQGNTACATFTYSGPLSFNNTAPQNNTPNGDLNSTFGFSAANISGYAGAGTVQFGSPATTVANYATQNGFLASSASIGGFSYGSLYAINLGTIASGTELTITHDDGVSLSGGSFSGSLTSAPTAALTETIEVTSTGPFTLYYARENGTPSVLDVAVPEPASIALLSGGLAALGLGHRRRKAA